jgi:hypothetical protein
VKTKKYYRRAFLNPKKGVAAFEAAYTTDTAGFSEGNLKITDCNHTVNLEFGFWTPETKQEQKQKLATLIDELTRVQAYLFPTEKI